MDPQPLNIRVDSKQAQADLAALARALDTAGNSASQFKSKFTSGMAGADTAVKGATAAMGKFAQVAALVSKIKISDDPAKQLKMLMSAMSQLGKMGGNIKGATSAMGQFAQVATLVDKIKINPASVKNLAEFSQAIAQVSKTRGPSTTSLKGLVNFIEVASRAQGLKFNPAMAANLRAFAAAMDSIGRARIITPARVTSLKELFSVLSNMKAPNGAQKLQSLFTTIASIRVPTDKAIQRLSSLFTTLANAKAIPGAAKIAHDLDTIAAAANRAGAAMNTLPKNLRGIKPAFNAAGGGAAGFSNNLKNIPGHVQKAHGSFGVMGKGLGELGGRFSLAYQASTLFSQFFAAFTVGEFLHKLYDTNIQLLKLQKALVFSTGSFAGAGRATDTYIGIANDLGLSLGKTTEAYAKFTLAAKSSGLDLNKSNDIYKSIGTALQVVGASSQQTELAFYGLQQMIQKGKVSAEEFNRQIGEQIPGNAVLGARALSKLEGHVVSVGEFFQKMSQGQILSAQFVPAYAEEVRKQFEPLIMLARERPDAALNRLTNSFFVFARAVGGGGMMTALTKEFDRLSAKIMYTDEAGTHLTPQFEKLAGSLGRGLTSAIHLLGDGLAFLTDHLDEVMTTLKLLLALRVGATFADWGKGAFAFAASLGGLVGGKAAATAVGATVTTAAAAAAQGAAPALGAIGPIAGGQLATRSIIARRSLGGFRTTTAAASGARATTDVRAVSRLVGLGMPLAEETAAASPPIRAFVAPRTAFGLRTAATASAGNKTGGIANALGGLLGMGGGAKTAATGIKEAEGAAVKAVSVFSRFGGVIGKVAPLLGLGLVGALAAGGIALAVFGDNTTKVQGQTMKFNDIVLGGFDVLKKGFSDWWDKSKPNFKFFTDAMSSLGSNSGEIVASIVAGFVTLGKVLGRVFSTIGTIIGEFIQHSPLATFVKIMAAVATGDFKGAGSILKESFSTGFGVIPIAKAVGGLVTGTIDDVKSYGDTRQQVIDAGASIAAARDQKVATDAATESQHAYIEATLAQAQAADAAAQKLGELDNINRQIALGNLGTPTAESLLKQAADAQAAGPATPATAAATNTNSAGAGSASAGADVRKGASPEVQAAIDAAASKYGVSADYLYRTAKRESGFDPNAHAKTSSASGLFQFTDATAQTYGLKDRKNAAASADAAARLTAQNGAYLQSKTGHTATDGELYAAHFLGAGGAAKLITAAMKGDPTITAASLFPAAAKANKSIFYSKDGRAKTASDVMTSFNDSYAGGSGSAGAAGAGAPQVTEANEESLTKKFQNAAETYNGLITRNASPAVAAQAAYDKYLFDTKELLNLQDDLHKKGVNTFVDTTKLADAMARADKELKQAINPFLKLNEEMEHGNDVLSIRAAGLTDQADYQQQLNQYVEQGYKLTELDTKANRDAFMQGKAREAQLQAQIGLTATLNDLQKARISRNGSPLDAAIAGRVDIQQGETYDQAVTRMKSQGTYGTAVKGAQAEVSQNQDFAKDDLRINLSEMQSTARLSSSARGYRDDFKSYLQELSGISTGTLSEIEQKAGPSLVALAKHAADVKYAIDNAPGFQKWADQIEPLAKKLNDLKGDFAEGLSDNLASALNGDKVDWSAFLHDFRKQIIKAQVQDVMKGLFGGKVGDALASPDEKIKSAADATTMAASSTATAATGLSTSATDLSTAAQSLSGAAQAIAQACSGAGMGASGYSAASAASGLGGAASDLGLTNLADNFIPAAQADPVGASLNTSMPSIPALLGAAATGNSGMGVVGQNDPDPVVTIMGKRRPLTNLADNFISAADLQAKDAANFKPFDPSSIKLPSITPEAGGGGGGILGSIGNFITQPQQGFAGLAKTAGLSAILGLLSHKKKKKEDISHSINGVIGQYGGTTMSGKEIAAHSNPIADVLNFGLSMAGASGFGAPGGNLTSALGFGKGAASGASAMSAASAAGTNNMGGWLKRMFAGFFSEGGVTTSPIAGAHVSAAAFAGAPHYREGTANVSGGGIPVIAHPDEAIIPLSKGRSVPVEMNGSAGSTNHFTTNMTIVTPDANSFRKSRSSIEREQGRSQRRSSLRNLSN